MIIPYRIVQWSPGGFEYESNQRHAEIIVKQMGLKPGSKSVSTPAVRVKPGEVEGDEKEVEPNEQTVFRGIAAGANHLRQDKSDIQFAVK